MPKETGKKKGNHTTLSNEDNVWKKLAERSLQRAWENEDEKYKT